MEFPSRQEPQAIQELYYSLRSLSSHTRSPSNQGIQQTTLGSASDLPGRGAVPETGRQPTPYSNKAREASLYISNQNEATEDIAMSPPPAYNPTARDLAPWAPPTSPRPPDTGPPQLQSLATPLVPITEQQHPTFENNSHRQTQEAPVVGDSYQITTANLQGGGSLLNMNALYSSFAGASGPSVAAGEMGQLAQPQPRVHVLVLPQDQIRGSQTLPLGQQHRWQGGGREGYGENPPFSQQHSQSGDLLARGLLGREIDQLGPGVDADAVTMGMEGPGRAFYRHSGGQTFQHARTSAMSAGSYDSSGAPSPSLFTSLGRSRSTRYSGATSIDDYQPANLPRAQSDYENWPTSPTEALQVPYLERHANPRNSTSYYRVGPAQEHVIASSQGGIDRLGTPRSASSLYTPIGASGLRAPGAVVLTGALTTEMNGGRDRIIIDNHLVSINRLASSSDKEAQKLVTAGVIPTLISLFKTRAVDGLGLEIVLVTLGMLAHDPITANTIFRTGTIGTVMELIHTPLSDGLAGLCIWFLTRLCRSNEVVNELIKLDLVRVLINRRATGSNITAQMASWCLGGLVRTDATADAFAAQGLLETSAKHLKQVASSSAPSQGDICSSIYVVARLSRSIKLAKGLAQAGCVPPLVHCLNTSTNSAILRFSARAVGCMMRPNSADISKILLDAGAAKGLARLPQVLSTKDIEPLESFAFAIQRFSCAEWGSTTRKALVEAGVVDSLLAALRTAADEPYPQTHIELALAVSFLGDVGGAPIRKEIIRAGGIDIMKRVGERGNPNVAKTCEMAVTSITGNLWTRNAASIRTAMSHNWSGGCPDHQPACPFLLAPD